MQVWYAFSENDHSTVGWILFVQFRFGEKGTVPAAMGI